ncbi:ABC transporter permease subunit [Liberiplasma polymorphum]|jgi:sodium transport system permease protein|uniref:ABC transporter permease subunit n=1 Tax=Liberiplasma polymorphum TaxID=3374570 RepID=UPI003775346A
MPSMWIIFKKEIFRVLSDKRLVLMVFILPGLSIFLMYTLMGNMIQNQATSVLEHQLIIYEKNMPESLRSMLNQIDDDGQSRINLDIHDGSALTADEIEEKLLNGEIDIVLFFDENFEQIILDYENQLPPNLAVYYNYGRSKSSFAYNQVMPVVTEYREMMLIDRLEDPNHYLVFMASTEQVVDERQVTGQGLAMLMPMLIVIFLFAGAMSIGPDAIAGEKERGTIATLLITPIKRKDIALGKVMSLATLALVSALSSFAGIMLSLPALMQLEEQGPSLNIYGVSDYLVILLVLVSTVLFIVSLIAVVSAYAKSVKEAGMLIMPFYFITIIVGIANSFGQEASQTALTHLIPLYGPVNLLSSIFTFDYSMLNVFIVVISSLIYTTLFVYILNLMFNNERIMFQK